MRPAGGRKAVNVKAEEDGLLLEPISCLASYIHAR